MAIVTTDNSNYSAIADAIRTKLNSAETFRPSEMASAIMSITGGGGITPTGTSIITSNGMFNVYNYASASVSVPVGVFPTGTYNITSNSVYDITNYQSVSVNVPTGITPTGTYSISSNGAFDITNYASVDVDVHPEHEDYIQKYTSATALKTFVDLSSTSVVYGAFAYTSSLATVSFPEATIIGNYAFAYCYKLSNISFPKVKTIYTYAFQYCSSLTMPINSTTFPALSGSLSGYVFRGCQYLTAVDHSALTSIGAQAFSACSRIKTVNLPNVTSTATGAFSYLTTCSQYSLPKLAYVGSNTFVSNWALTAITLPAVTTISAYAFRYCSNLMSLYLTGSTVPTLNASAFLNMPFSVSVNSVYGSIYVPSSLYNTYSTATNWATYKNRLVSITE